jgi:hypothetical protein
MALLRDDHPWNPGYAIPKNVLDEPFGQGVLVTGYTPRGTISSLQPSWFRTGNALQAAAQVAKEQAVGGLGSLGGLGGIHGSLGCTALSRPTLSGSSIEPDRPAVTSPTTVVMGGSNDPIANFGRQGAAAVLRYIKSVPVADRSTAMKTFLDQLDPGLWKSVADKATALQKEKGYNAPKALQKALQIMLADRLFNQFAKIGKTGSVPTSGLLGLIDPQQRAVALSGLESLGFGLSSITGAVKSAANTVASTATSVAKDAGKFAINASGAVITGGASLLVNKGDIIQTAKDAGSAIKSGAIAVKNAAADAINKLGDIACKTLGNPATAQVAGAVPHPYAQAAALGSQIAQGLCGSGVSPVTEQPYTPPPPGIPTSVLIAGAAGVGLLALVALRK